MRVIFSMLGLLAVVVVVGLLVKSQLRAVQPKPMAEAAVSQSAAPLAATADSNIPADARALQNQAADRVGKALDAGVQRNRGAEGGK